MNNSPTPATYFHRCAAWLRSVFVLALAPSPSVRAGTAVTLPAASVGCGLKGGGRSLGVLRHFESAVMPEIAGRGVLDLVHGGSSDLTLWPASLAEMRLAAEWLDTGSPATRDELYALCQSIDRAGAIAEWMYINRSDTVACLLLISAFRKTPS